MNFWTKYRAITLAEECARSAIKAGGTNPTDCEGNCLLPSDPLEGDWDYFHKIMEKWCTDGYGQDEEDVFQERYSEILRDRIKMYHE